MSFSSASSSVPMPSVQNQNYTNGAGEQIEAVTLQRCIDNISNIVTSIRTFSSSRHLKPLTTGVVKNLKMHIKAQLPMLQETFLIQNRLSVL
ncbi:unnamed protein product [Adineta ricciae]|uniref:Uncharacterized protein n=1 Tax=Adineta ricciae TaxID=249248 RepID=A0A814F8K8_ADIRI|nr:unnamed protein product [Adineta ricciae]